VRALAHIKKLDDCFGDFLVRVVCECGACREIQPQALARLVGWKMTLKELALRMRFSQCGKKAAEVVAGGEAQAARSAEESTLTGRGFAALPLRGRMPGLGRGENGHRTRTRTPSRAQGAALVR
jgi:hypothetical protein